jgi:hypothetical protein
MNTKMRAGMTGLLIGGALLGSCGQALADGAGSSGGGGSAHQAAGTPLGQLGEHLPDEIVLHILGNLPIGDLLNFAATDKRAVALLPRVRWTDEARATLATVPGYQLQRLLDRLDAAQPDRPLSGVAADLAAELYNRTTLCPACTHGTDKSAGKASNCPACGNPALLTQRLMLGKEGPYRCQHTPHFSCVLEAGWE